MEQNILCERRFSINIWDRANWYSPCHANKIYGASAIYCIDINQNRVDFCKKINLGICINGLTSEIDNLVNLNDKLRPDLIIIATSDMSVLCKSLDIIRKGGTILLFGEPQKEIDVKILVNFTQKK